MKDKEFRKRVLEVSDKYSKTYEGTLKEYLMAFWHIVQFKKENELSLEVLCDVVEQAFNLEPISFDAAWLKYTNEPYIDFKKKDFKDFKNAILFQISDLHKMEDESLLDNELKYFGIDSPTGNRWNNFDPFTYLGCATGWFEDYYGKYSIEEPDEETNISWSMLIRFLEMGRLYE